MPAVNSRAKLLGGIRAVLPVLIVSTLFAAGEAAASTYYADAARPDDTGDGLSWDTADPDSSLCVVFPSVVSRVLTITGATVTAATRLRGFKVTDGYERTRKMVLLR